MTISVSGKSFTRSSPLYGNGVEEVPKGFESWYKIQERLGSQVFFEVDRLLSENEPFSAIDIFFSYTKYNKEKVWH